MRFALRLLRRLLVVAYAYLAASATGSVTFVMAASIPILAIEWSAGRSVPDWGLPFILMFTPGVLVAMALGVPAGISAILIGEVFRLRSKWLYGSAGPVWLLGLLLFLLCIGRVDRSPSWADAIHLAALLVASILAGLTYWHIAGRSAGRWRADPQ